MTYEDIKPIVDRMRQKTASALDHVLYMRFELEEAMKVLPPDNEREGHKIDNYHAGCCCLRAYAASLNLGDLLKIEPVLIPTRDGMLNEVTGEVTAK